MCFVNHCSVVPTDTRAKCLIGSHVYCVLSLSFVDHWSLGPIYTITKYLMLPQFFVYSRCSFVDHWSLCSKDTNAKYLMVPTFILYSRSASWIIRRWVRFTPTQHHLYEVVPRLFCTLAFVCVDHSFGWVRQTPTQSIYEDGPMFILHSRFASLIIGRCGSERHPRKNTLMIPTFYFVLSLSFVDHWSLGPVHTNAKYINDSHVYFVLSLCFVDRCSLEKRNIRQVARTTTYDYRCFSGLV